jgi:hypothetical protein
VPAEPEPLVQGVGLAPMAMGDRPWLTMIADLFAETELAHRTALLYQDRLPFGSLVLREGAYLLRHGMPLAELALPELAWTIRVLAFEAARLRLNVRRHGPQGDPFGNYAE